MVSEEEKIERFLAESNFIEGVYDKQSFDEALSAWEYVEKIPAGALDLFVIRQVHRKLMLRHLGEGAGIFRNVNVRVGNRDCPPYDQVLRLLDQWAMNHGRAKTVDEIKRAHIAFEKIHPFVDGNGRTGRIIMNWQNLKAGLPIEIIFEKDKEKYYQWFK